MKIAILMEGTTEKVFLPHLRDFLHTRLEGRMPRLIPNIFHGRIPKEAKLKRVVEDLLRTGNPNVDDVIALTDVYTGSGDFRAAADAKRKMRDWVGPNPHFHPHVAQHDFEAWLLPYWSDIRQLARHNRNPPAGPPESVNHNHPPSWHIKEVFRAGQGPREYIKTRDAKRILEGKDLGIAIAACPEFRAFVNTILRLSGGTQI